MSQRLIDVALPRIADASFAVPALVAIHVLFNLLANVAFRLSARGATWTDVVVWQIAGNVAGFTTVVALTVLLRYLPLGVAFPVTTGCSVIAVQVVAARWLFAEPIGAMQWSGALLIALGVFLVQR
jgi:multidrug transporter EmrE-like cation transporter